MQVALNSTCICVLITCSDGYNLRRVIVLTCNGAFHWVWVVLGDTFSQLSQHFTLFAV